MTLLFIRGTGGPRPAGGMALSSTLTAALPAFTKALAPVRVNLIAAGFVDTPLSASLLGDNLETLDDRPKGLAILERIRTSS